MSNHKTTPGLTELMNAADKILNQQGFIKDDPPKASDLWDIPSEAYDAAEQLLQEQETGGKKEEFIPPDHGDVCWTIGAETFTRKEVFMLLHTQRSMIINDLKRYAGNDLTENIYAVLNFPRKPEF